MAASNLVIVESPSKARTLAKFLGSDYEVKASLGHLVDLPKSKLGIDVDRDFAPDYIVIKGKEAQVRELRQAARKAQRILLAADPDREGEAIAWHIAQQLHLKDPERIVFHEVTRLAVEAALREPRPIDQHLVDAQQARRVIDRLVGYKLSPLLWRKIRKGLSAGRVQSVALRLVCDREGRSPPSCRWSPGAWTRCWAPPPAWRSRPASSAAGRTARSARWSSPTRRPRGP